MNQAQARLWREFDQYVNRAVGPYADRAERLLELEGRRAVEGYRQYGEAGAIDAIKDRPWEMYLSRLWRDVTPEAGELVTDWLTPLKAAPVDPFDRAVSAWLRVNGAQRVQGITDTSRQEIGNQIRIGVSKGESRAQIEMRILKHRRSIAPGRAHVIARTEVHTAANYGSWVAASDVNVALDKVWVATPDNRTRDAHMRAHGQRRSLNATFEVGGEQLMFPGSGGSAANTVNCRCTLSYQVARRVRRPRAA